MITGSNNLLPFSHSCSIPSAQIKSAALSSSAHNQILLPDAYANLGSTLTGSNIPFFGSVGLAVIPVVQTGCDVKDLVRVVRGLLLQFYAVWELFGGHRCLDDGEQVVLALGGCEKNNIEKVRGRHLDQCERSPYLSMYSRLIYHTISV